METNTANPGTIITDGAAGVITRVEELSYELRVAQVMARAVRVVSPHTRIETMLDMLRQGRISGAPVVADEALVGIISIEDLLRALLNGDLHATVGEYMTRRVVTVKASDPVVEALKLFAQARVGRLPVVDAEGRLVGILTKGDITAGVLRALQSDYQAEEVRRYRASHLFEDIESERSSLILRYNIRPRDFTLGGQASSQIKRALLRLGASPQIARRCGIAAYEAEMNLVIHTTHGGVIRVEIEPHLITMKATDDGPGIEDVARAQQPGFSTATQEVREMGFGAGMGLTNILRCADDMTLDSTPGQGTKLTVKIHLPRRRGAEPAASQEETAPHDASGDHHAAWP
jgi:CBS domain-containing protein/anti-sigma regulatory factor (Ser/Thr protein kinase)